MPAPLLDYEFPGAAVTNRASQPVAGEEPVEQEATRRVTERPKHTVLVLAHASTIGDHTVTCQVPGGVLAVSVGLTNLPQNML